MPKFNFQVDRAYRVLTPFKLSPTVELMGEPFEPAVGQDVIYRGLVEIDHKARHVFVVDGRKGYTIERAQFENALEERLDELVQP